MTDNQLNQKITDYIPLVWGTLTKMGILEKEEYFTCGLLGLLKAIQTYNPDKGLKFESFAAFKIKTFVIDEIRKNSMVSRGDLEKGFRAQFIPLTNTNDEGEEYSTFHDVTEETPYTQLEELDLKRFINEHINNLPKKQAKVMKLINKGKLLEEIGSKMSLTKARVCQIRQEAIQNLRQNIYAKVKV